MTNPILVKGLYSIEAELGTNFFNDNIDYLDSHRESNNIEELIGLHNCDDEFIQTVSDIVSSHYKDNKPIGEDGLISGGWHIHIFDTKLMNHIKFDITPRELKYLLLNNPFWINYKMGRGILRKISSRCSFSIDDEVYPRNSKGKVFCIKSEYYSHNEELDGDEYEDDLGGTNSFEIRVNDVMDGKVFYMYKAMILAKVKGVKFKRTSDDFRDFLKRGIDVNYGDDEMSLEELAKDGYKISEEDKDTFVKNMYKLYNFAKRSEDFTEDEIKYIEEYIVDICDKLKEEYTISTYKGQQFSWGNLNTTITFAINNNIFNLTNLHNILDSNYDFDRIYNENKKDLKRVNITKAKFIQAFKTNVLNKALEYIKGVEEKEGVKIIIK